MNQEIYLDYAASTPLDPEVAAVMSEWMSIDGVGNPHAKNHIAGLKASKAVYQARQKIADHIKTDPENVIFTSGATEANNIVLLGLKDYLLSNNKRHIITSKVEHKSVLNVFRSLEDIGFQVTYLTPKPCGMIEAGMVQETIEENTGLVSIQALNNEVGVINPLAEISDMLQGRDILFHVDGAQALGKMPIDLQRLKIDLMSFSGHKVYGPQGVGALYIGQDILTPIMYGGGQEKGLRSGTLSTALCVGFGKACSLIDVSDNQRLRVLRHSLLTKIKSIFPSVEVFGHSDDAWQFPGIISLCFPEIDNETVLMLLPHICLGTGSACGADKNEPSHVITAIANEQKAHDVIRISFGRFTTEDEIERFGDQLIEAVKHIYLEIGKVA